MYRRTPTKEDEKVLACAKRVKEYCAGKYCAGSDDCRGCIFDTELGCAFADSSGKEIDCPADWWI